MSQPETMNVPYIGERTTWDVIVETAYENMVEYLLRDHAQWTSLYGTHPPVKRARWQRMRESILGNLDRARYKVGHWIAGECPEPNYY